MKADILIIIFIGINVLTVLLNIAILGLCIKLYTEYFKDKSIVSRKYIPPPEHPNCRCTVDPPKDNSNEEITNKTF